MMGYRNGVSVNVNVNGIGSGNGNGIGGFQNVIVPPPMSNLPGQQGVGYVPLAGGSKAGLGFQKNPVSKNRKKEAR